MISVIFYFGVVMKRIIISLLSLFLIAGCATNRVDYNKSSLQLGIGMTKPEVLSIMGEPRRSDVTEDRERWIYWNKVMMGYLLMDNESLAQDRLVVTFRDGKVSRWGNQTLTDDIMEASQKTIDASHKAAQEASKQTQ